MAQQTAFFFIFFLPPLLLPFAMNFKNPPCANIFAFLSADTSLIYIEVYHMVIECPIKSHRRDDKS